MGLRGLPCASSAARQGPLTTSAPAAEGSLLDAFGEARLQAVPPPSSLPSISQLLQRHNCTLSLQRIL